MALHLHALPAPHWRTWFDPDGNIEICRTGPNTLLWKPSGRSYRPQQVSYLRTVTWTIHEGTGLISLNGEERFYKPGDTFTLCSGGIYSLTRIDSETLVEATYQYPSPYHHA